MLRANNNTKADSCHRIIKFRWKKVWWVDGWMGGWGWKPFEGLQKITYFIFWAVSGKGVCVLVLFVEVKICSLVWFFGVLYFLVMKKVKINFTKLFKNSSTYEKVKKHSRDSLYSIMEHTLNTFSKLVRKLY